MPDGENDRDKMERVANWRPQFHVSTGDSLERIEREMAAFGEPGPGPQVMTKGTIAEWADRLRALRERDEKRLKQIEDDCRAEASHMRKPYGAHMLGVADRLRAAREGRDA